MSMYKLGGSSTLTVVNAIKALVPIAAKSLPPDLSIKALFDQSLLCGPRFRACCMRA